MATDIDRLKDNLRRWTLVLGVLQITVGCVVGFIPLSAVAWFRGIVMAHIEFTANGILMVVFGFLVRDRVARLAASASRVRSTRNLDETFNGNHDRNLEFNVHSVFLVAAPPTFCEGGLPDARPFDPIPQRLLRSAFMDESSPSLAPESRPRRRVIDDPQTAHFITFGCDRRRKLLNQDRCKRIVVHFLEEVRAEYEGLCLGFVIMPEHIHVLIRFRERGWLIPFKQEWKRRSSVALVEYFQKTKNPILEFLTLPDGSHRVWTPKQHDFNVRSHHKAWEKLNYMHQNPAKRDLALTPESWRFSSARWYSARKSVGVTLAHIDD